jgi:hypothetical protein
MEGSFIRNKLGILAAFLAVAPIPPAAPSEIISATVEVPAHDYRAFSSHIVNWPAVFHAGFEVASGPPVQITLLARGELNAFASGRKYESLVEMTARRSGKFDQMVPEKGDYDIVLVNDADAPAMVRLHATVQYASEPDVAVYLSPARRLAVILVSLLVFGITFGWSAWKVIAGMRK